MDKNPGSSPNDIISYTNRPNHIEMLTINDTSIHSSLKTAK